MNWIPFSKPVSVRVARTPDEGHHAPGYEFYIVDVLAWRWNDDKNNVEYLGVSGMIWPGKSGKSIGVTSVERKTSK